MRLEPVEVKSTEHCQREQSVKYKKYIIAGLGVCALLLIIWQMNSRVRFPREPIRTVNSFSLGSAHFTPFKHRPGGKELYDRMLKLYNSFTTLAMTCSHRTKIKGDWEWIDQPGLNTRIKQPSMLMQVNDDYTYVFVANGPSACQYWRGTNKYLFARDNKVNSSRIDIPVYLYLINPDAKAFHTKILRYDLMPDQRINGDEVYVLKLTTAERPITIEDYSLENQKHRALPSVTKTTNKAQNMVTRIFYLGKSDLLLRKLEIIDPDQEALAKFSHIVYLYSGMVANLNLPNRMFDTTPPKGAKRAKTPHVKLHS